MNYEDAMHLVFATGKIANGYCGDVTKVGFCINPFDNRIWCVSSFGCFPWARSICGDDFNDPYATLEGSDFVFGLKHHEQTEGF